MADKDYRMVIKLSLNLCRDLLYFCLLTFAQRDLWLASCCFSSNSRWKCTAWFFFCMAVFLIYLFGTAHYPIGLAMAHCTIILHKQKVIIFLFYCSNTNQNVLVFLLVFFFFALPCLALNPCKATAVT